MWRKFQLTSLHEGRANIRVMPLKISSDPAPLVTDEDGVVRVEGTRVRLDTVVFAFNQGASAEEILQQYPSLTLSDIYATSAITYSTEAPLTST